ncbi:barstar family protein [Amycolatopsis sp. OK19-0408]|uniref:Barstar family protein n=1 Tax=Amycolatopsis iheyensis TaxID=2945988 RepID=A0A9X2SRR4_9PSEU|nr:barstar family protein [Amycolatopsis iheyensis]MCR6490585.1 barstar family protein [Amycolatopsis iheyensis]
MRVVRPRYVLVEDDGERRIPCADADRVFSGRPGDPVWLLGCDLPDDLLDRLNAGRRVPPFVCSFEVIDRFGLETCLGLVTFDVAEWSPSGGGHVDLALRSSLHDPPRPAGQAVWDQWFDGGPPVKNLWAGHDRTEWLRAALAHRFDGPDLPPGETYRLDGTHLTDLMSYYCALGEAVNGPGGYFGWNLGAVEDCLRGGFGATRPFTLVGPVATEAREVLEELGITLRPAP